MSPKIPELTVDEAARRFIENWTRVEAKLIPNEQGTAYTRYNRPQADEVRPPPTIEVHRGRQTPKFGLACLTCGKPLRDHSISSRACLPPMGRSKQVGRSGQVRNRIVLGAYVDSAPSADRITPGGAYR